MTRADMLERLGPLLEKAQKELSCEELNVVLHINSRLRSTVAQVRTTPYYLMDDKEEAHKVALALKYPEDEYGADAIIEVNDAAAEEYSDDDLVDTLKHELAHVITGGDHGGIEFEGFLEKHGITKTAPKSMSSEEPWRYVVKCLGCGLESMYKRKSKTVKNAERGLLECRDCGGSIAVQNI